MYFQRIVPREAEDDKQNDLYATHPTCLGWFDNGTAAFEPENFVAMQNGAAFGYLDGCLRCAVVQCAYRVQHLKTHTVMNEFIQISMQSFNEPHCLSSSTHKMACCMAAKCTTFCACQSRIQQPNSALKSVQSPIISGRAL
jgi:hypothetical protein